MGLCMNCSDRVKLHECSVSVSDVKILKSVIVQFSRALFQNQSLRQTHFFTCSGARII